ncbi:MAG TPA: MFS transporter [Stellaceae bacterium]|nr:MFS transporter [Stellaceae bacterium]
MKAAMDTGRGWLVVAAAFSSSFVVFGVVYSFGVFLQPIAAEFHADPAAASAFFSITAVVYYGLGAFAGRAADRFGPRAIVAAGAAILGLGLGLTALVHQIWAGYLTYGLGVGIGGACCYVPPLASVGGWFDKHRNTALGVAATGTGAGTMAVPPIAAALIHHFGWRLTDVILAAAAAIILIGCAVMVRSPPSSGRADVARRPLRHLFRQREFLLLYLSWALATTALFVPFVFLPAFARDHGASDIAGAALVSLIGGTSIAGRLVLGPIGDRAGVLRLFKITTLTMALSYAIWLFSSSYAWLVVFAVVLGAGYGSRIAAVPAVLIEFFGLDNLGTTLGAFFTATGLAALVGPPLAGIAVDLGSSYDGGILFALATGLLGFAAIAALRSEPFGRHRSDRA